VSTTPQISLVIPALNEAPNLPPLLEQVAAALAGREGGYEVIVVDDDSRDNTKETCAELAARYPLRLTVRERPANGLSGAVLHGIGEAKGEYIVVMDADLQHPPAKIPELLAPLERGEADFVVGSRYVPGGSIGERWGVLRKINSRIATLLARPFAGRTTDPMSGFFALKRATYAQAQRLTPLGYKIALELMCKSRVQNVREIPIHFAERTRGESKLTLKEQFRYLEHLSRLYDFTFPRLSPIVKFLIVLAVSWLVGFAIFFSLTSAGVAPPAVAVGVAYLFAIAVTAVFHLRYVRTQREFIIRPRPWLDFVLISAAELIVCVAAAQWVASRVAAPTWADLFVIPFLLATVVRYVLRKELLQDVRGLRKEVRKEELT
jgi:dolichol-phosphate mannosyltransferase